MARLGSAAIVALLLSVSCFFPSIDALEGDGKKPAEDAGGESDGTREEQRITCGDKQCFIPYQVCCAATEVSCFGAENDCPGLRIACDGDEDCAGTSEGKICCMVDDKAIGCRPSCANPVCTTDPSRCPDGTTCKEIASGGGHKACQD